MGMLDTVKLLLNHGSQINLQDKDGQTALYHASFNGHIAVVKELLATRADGNLIENNNINCQMADDFDRHTDVVSALVSAEADVNLQSNDGFSPLIIASKEGHDDIVKLLVHNGAEIETRNDVGETPLYWAASKGHVAIVQFLIEHRSNVNACTTSGQSCLLAAVFGGHTEVVRALVSAGADVNFQWITDTSDQSLTAVTEIFLVINALFQHAIDCIAQFIDRGNVTSAISSINIERVKTLLREGAQRDNRMSPLNVASSLGFNDIVKLLLDNNADIESRDIKDIMANSAIHPLGVGK